MSKLTIDDIQRCFWLDGAGTVRWKESVATVLTGNVPRFCGGVAGCLTAASPEGIVYRKLGYTKAGWRREVYAHTIAFVLYNGRFPEGDIDHIDGNGCNNAGNNLRDVSRRVNMCNAKLNVKNTTGVKGVTLSKQHPGMYQASAKLAYKKHHLYWGGDFFEACCARKSFEAHHDHTDRAYSSQTYRKVNPQAQAQADRR